VSDRRLFVLFGEASLAKSGFAGINLYEAMESLVYPQCMCSGALQMERYIRYIQSKSREDCLPLPRNPIYSHVKAVS
jgi:hypothetical protein